MVKGRKDQGLYSFVRRATYLQGFGKRVDYCTITIGLRRHTGRIRSFAQYSTISIIANAITKSLIIKEAALVLHNLDIIVVLLSIATFHPIHHEPFISLSPLFAVEDTISTRQTIPYTSFPSLPFSIHINAVDTGFHRFH